MLTVVLRRCFFFLNAGWWRSVEETDFWAICPPSVQRTGFLWTRLKRRNNRILRNISKHIKDWECTTKAHNSLNIIHVLWPYPFTHLYRNRPQSSRGNSFLLCFTSYKTFFHTQKLSNCQTSEEALCVVLGRTAKLSHNNYVCNWK